MFTLTIPVTTRNLDLIKAELTRTLSHVKSSHRCEAIGRGLGFLTYASARNAASGTDKIEANVRGDLFRDYLAEHGIDESAVAFLRAAARTALANLRDATPNLTVWGMGIGRPQRKEDGKLETAVELRRRFAQERDDLTRDVTVEAFLVTLALLTRVPATKTVRQGSGSYWLKHIAENHPCSYPTGEKLGPRYVPNGAAIAAALHAGFKCKTYVDEYGCFEINVSFNMSKSLLVDLDCEMRPTGAHAQDRKRREEERQHRSRYRHLYRQFPAGLVVR